MNDSDFVLNRNPDSIDVLHRSPTEVCNSDDVVDRSKVDAKTAAALIATGEARTCKHCIGPDE